MELLGLLGRSQMACARVKAKTHPVQPLALQIIRRLTQLQKGFQGNDTTGVEVAGNVLMGRIW